MNIKEISKDIEILLSAMYDAMITKSLAPEEYDINNYEEKHRSFINNYVEKSSGMTCAEVLISYLQFNNLLIEGIAE